MNSNRSQAWIWNEFSVKFREYQQKVIELDFFVQRASD